MATDISVTINPAPTIAATIGEGISPHAFTHAPGGSDSVAQWYATSGDLISVSGQIPITTGFVSVTGNQTVSGVKNFISRPTVNGTGVLLSGEADNTGFITGYVQKSETGNFVTNSQTGSLTGSFYPLGTNPSGYIVGAVVRPSNTGIFVDLGGSQTISGQKTFTKALVSPSLLIGTGNFSSGAYNSSIGTGNQIFGEYNASLGNDNKIGQSVTTADLSQDNVIVGISNIIDGEQVSDNILIGKANALNKAEVSSLTQPNYFDNTVVGFGNSINHTTDDPNASHTNNAIFGVGNILYGGRSNVVVGINNYSLSEYTDSLIFGQGNEIFGNQSMGIGFGAITSGQETIVIRGPQGLFLEGPLTFNQRPTLDGVGFLLSGEVSGVSTTGILITGTSTKTIILYQSDGSTVSGSFTDQQGSGSGSDFYIYSGSFNTGNGQLTLNRTGDAGSVVIPLDGRYVTGQVVRANETGSFATTGFVSGVSGYLQGQVNSLTGQTGNYALSSQTGAFLTTGAADSRYVAQSATGAYTGVFYPRNSNPSGYLVSGDLNPYATTSSLTGVSGHLQGQINVLTGQTGTYVTGLVVRPSETGAFLTTGDGDARYLRIPSVREIYIDAGAMLTGISGATPTTTSVGSISYDGYDFDPSTTGFAQFKISLADYDLNSLKLKFNWGASSTGSVVWGVQSTSVGDGDSLSFSWGNPQEVTDSFITGTGIHQSAATSGLVPTGAPQSGDTLFFRIYRNTFSASDTISTSATLFGVSIQYTGNLITAW